MHYICSLIAIYILSAFTVSAKMIIVEMPWIMNGENEPSVYPSNSLV